MYNLFIDLRDLSGYDDKYYNDRGVGLPPKNHNSVQYNKLKHSLDKYEIENKLPLSKNLENWKLADARDAVNSILANVNEYHMINSDNLNFLTPENSTCLCYTKITRLFAIINKNDDGDKKGVAFIGSSCINHMSGDTINQYKKLAKKYSEKNRCYVCLGGKRRKKLYHVKCKSKTLFYFGKYKSKSIHLVHSLDPEYTQWILDDSPPDDRAAEFQNIIKNYLQNLY